MTEYREQTTKTKNTNKEKKDNALERKKKKIT